MLFFYFFLLYVFILYVNLEKGKAAIYRCGNYFDVLSSNQHKVVDMPSTEAVGRRSSVKKVICKIS